MVKTNLFDDDSVSPFAVTYRRSSAFNKAYTRDKQTPATGYSFSNTEGEFNDTLRSAIDSEVSRTIPDSESVTSSKLGRLLCKIPVLVILLED